MRDGKPSRIFTEYMTDAKLLLTSTPMQDSIDEFYNLLHFIDPDQFHTADVFNKFGQTEHFREAVKKCEITSVSGEQELMNENVIPMQQIQSNAAPALQGVVQTQQ